MQENNKPQYRIGILAIVVLFITACIFDGLTFIPFVGDLIAWVFWVGSAIYYWKAGLGLANWKVLVPEILSFAAELVPAVQELPTMIAATVVIVAMSRVEDRFNVSLIPGKKITPARRPPPLNNSGIRPPRSELADETEQSNNIVKAKFKDDLEDLDMAA